MTSTLDIHRSIDGLERTVSAKHPFETATASYTLDDAGNVITETGNPAGTGEFTYDFTDNRLITRTPTDPAGAAFEYAYDHFGNQRTQTQGTDVTTNAYDASSQPAETADANGTVSYGYDGLGRMVWRTNDTPDEKTLFFHDGLSQQITVETDETGDRQTRYLLDSSGSPMGQEQKQGTTLRRSYFVTDPRGNLTQLLSQAETVRSVFAYDPFGKPKNDLTEVTANWDSRLRFQMAPKDAATGNYNLGARLMNPNINRFIGADNYVGAAANVALLEDPLTGNRYMYAGAHPAGLIDDGHGWCPFGRKNAQDKDSACNGGWIVKQLKQAPSEIASTPKLVAEGAKFGRSEVKRGARAVWRDRGLILEGTQETLGWTSTSLYGLAAGCVAAVVCAPAAPELAGAGLSCR
ncbi:hypothetical protein BH23ACT12_BH23ACT12_01960 [soil metagenome]